MLVPLTPRVEAGAGGRYDLLFLAEIILRMLLLNADVGF